jgi:PAS domain S-box-containing protein
MHLLGKIRSSISLKFNLVVALIVFLFMGTGGFLLMQREKITLENNLHRMANTLAVYIARSSIDPILYRDVMALEGMMEDARQTPDLVYSFISDSKGNPLTSAAGSLNTKNPEVQKTLGKNPEGDIPFLIQTIKQQTDILEITHPITLEGDQLGTVTVGFSRYSIQAFQHKTSQILAVAISLMIAALILTITGMFRIIISRPLGNASTGAKQIAMGNFSARMQIRSNDEVGQLSTALNAMAETLSKTTVSKDYVENILRSMADALIVIDREGTIQRVNRVTPQMLGSSEFDLLGKPIDSIIPEYRALHPRNHNPQAQDTVHNSETFLLTANQKQVHISLSSSNLYDADQQVIGTVLLAQDITERKKSEEVIRKKSCELERINKELDQFAYVVSHDLKAPLRAIANLAQWIEEDLVETIDDDIREQLNLLRGRVTRMEGLINGILEYSRIGRVEAAAETVDVRALLEESIDLMPVPEGFTINISQDMPMVTASRIRLGQVFANLLSNAIKYNLRPDGRVEITVEETDSFYTFSVSDNGPGIDPKFHEKIFVIFQTLAARDKVEGTGIGLTLIKKIIEEQGGTIGIESEEGKGATFRFTWPKPTKEEKAA